MKLYGIYIKLEYNIYFNEDTGSFHESLPVFQLLLIVNWEEKPRIRDRWFLMYALEASIVLPGSLPRKKILLSFSSQINFYQFPFSGLGDINFTRVWVCFTSSSRNCWVGFCNISYFRSLLFDFVGQHWLEKLLLALPGDHRARGGTGFPACKTYARSVELFLPTQKFYFCIRET